MAEKPESLGHRLSSVQNAVPTNNASVNAASAEVPPLPVKAISVSQSSKHFDHRRNASILERLFSAESHNPMYKKTSLSTKIQASFIVGSDLEGDDNPPYVRIHSHKAFQSLISTKKMWCPPPTAIFYADKPGDDKHLESPCFPIAIDITDSNIKFPKIVLDNIKSKPKMYFVVQTGGNGQSLHGEQGIFSNEQVENVLQVQASTMNTVCKTSSSIEIYSLNPKIKCENAKITSLNSDQLDVNCVQELKNIQETSFCCYYAAGIRTNPSPIKLNGLNPDKTEHFISKITSQKGDIILTYHWIIPRHECYILNINICNPLLDKQSARSRLNEIKLSTLMKQFESFKEIEISKMGKDKIPSFLLEPLETLKRYLEFKPLKNITIDPNFSRSRSKSSLPGNNRNEATPSPSVQEDLSCTPQSSQSPELPENTLKIDATRKFTDLAEKSIFCAPILITGDCINQNNPIPLQVGKEIENDIDNLHSLQNQKVQAEKPKIPTPPLEKPKSEQTTPLTVPEDESSKLPKKSLPRLSIARPKSPQRPAPRLSSNRPKSPQRPAPRLPINRPKSPQRAAPRLSINRAKSPQKPAPRLSISGSKLEQTQTTSPLILSGLNISKKNSFPDASSLLTNKP